ncbi:titin homolog isoform X3 [Protopterus annectens]|uniref:titin homolog isoform X2 n=1 Tax=Protopterus annectens TaxID=7888 RepID=UPI001CFADE6B|nr:titin homolog isoform X2 [Protopterus annectens]XP_043940449.1 titin homolog isoform X3 [Protopterus annectens]
MEVLNTTNASEMETLVNGESGQQVKQENQSLQETPAASPVNKKSNVKTAVVKPRTVKSTTDGSTTTKQGTSSKPSSPSKPAPLRSKPTSGTTKPTADSSKTSSGTKRLSAVGKTDSSAGKNLTNGVPKRPAAPDRKLPPVSQSKTKPASLAQTKDKNASTKIINGPSGTTETQDKKVDAGTEKTEKVQSVKKSTSTTSSTAKPKTNITAVKTSSFPLSKGTVGSTKPEKPVPSKTERSVGSAPSSTKPLGPSAAKTSAKPPAAVKVKKAPVSSGTTAPSGGENTASLPKKTPTGQKENAKTAAVSRKQVPSSESKIASVKSAKKEPVKPGTRSTPTGQNTEASKNLQTTPNLKSPDKAKVRLQQSASLKSSSQKEKSSPRPNTLPPKPAAQRTPTSTKSETSVKAVPKKKLVVNAVTTLTHKEPEDRGGASTKEAVVSGSEIPTKETEDVQASLQVEVNAQESVESCKMEASDVKLTEEMPVTTEILHEEVLLEKALPEMETKKVMVYLEEEMPKADEMPETLVMSETLVHPELETEKVLIEEKQREYVLTKMLPGTEAEKEVLPESVMIPVAEAEKQVLPEVEVIIVTEEEEMPDVEVIPVTEAEKQVLPDVEVIPVTEAEKQVLPDVEVIPVTEAEKQVLPEVEVIPVTEAVEVIPVTEAEEEEMPEVEVIPVTEAEEEMPEVEVIPVTEAEKEEMPEVEVIPVTEAEKEEMPEVEVIPVTDVEKEEMPEVEVIPVTEVEKEEMPEVEVIPVTEAEKEEMPEVEMIPVTEAEEEEMPEVEVISVTEAEKEEMPEVEVMPVTEAEEEMPGAEVMPVMEKMPEVEAIPVMEVEKEESELPEKMLQETKSDKEVMLQDREDLDIVNEMLCSGEIDTCDQMKELHMYDQKESDKVCIDDFIEDRTVEFHLHAENVAVTQSVQDSWENTELGPQDGLKEKSTLNGEHQKIGMLHPAGEREGIAELRFSEESAVRGVKEPLCTESTPGEENISRPCSEVLSFSLLGSEQKVEEPCTENEDLHGNVLSLGVGSSPSSTERFSDEVSVKQHLIASPEDSNLLTSRVQTEAFSASLSEYEEKYLKEEQVMNKDESSVDRVQQETSEQCGFIAPHVGTVEFKDLKEKSLPSETEELVSGSEQQNKDALLNVQLANAEEYPPAFAENVDVLHDREKDYEEIASREQREWSEAKGCTPASPEGVMKVDLKEHSASEENSYFTMCSEDQLQENVRMQVHGEQEALLLLADSHLKGKSFPCEEMEEINDYESVAQFRTESTNEVGLATVNLSAERGIKVEEYFSDSNVNETVQASKTDEYAEPDKTSLLNAYLEEKTDSIVVICESEMEGTSLDYRKKLTHAEEAAVSEAVDEMVCVPVGVVSVNERCEMSPQGYALPEVASSEVEHSMPPEMQIFKNVDYSKKPEQKVPFGDSECDQKAVVKQYEQTSSEEKNDASEEETDASDTVAQGYEHPPRSYEMPNVGLELPLDELCLHQLRESQTLSKDMHSVVKPQTLPVQFESSSEQNVVPPPEHENTTFVDLESVGPEDQSPEKGPSHSSTLSGAELAGKSSSETSTPEELRDYDSSSGVESRSEEKLEYFLDHTDSQINKFSSPLDELPGDQDLGIHLEKGDEAETIPADELLGDPPTEPTVSSEDDHSDADEDLIKETMLQGIDNPVFEEKSKQSSVLEVEVCKSPGFHVEGSEDQAFSETPVSDEAETPVSDVENEMPPLKEAEPKDLTCNIKVASGVLSSEAAGVDLVAIACEADMHNYEALPLKYVPFDKMEDFKALPSDAGGVESVLPLDEEEAELETLPYTAERVTRASDAAGLDVHSAHFSNSPTSDLSLTCNIPVEAESLSESDQVTPDITSETTPTESDHHCSPKSDILIDHMHLHKLNEAESRLSSKWDHSMLLEESGNLVSDHFGSAGSKAGSLFGEDFSSPLRHVVAAAVDEEHAQGYCSAACEKTDSEVPGNV